MIVIDRSYGTTNKQIIADIMLSICTRHKVPYMYGIGTYMKNE